MPIPLLFIGIAALSATTGIGQTVKAVSDQYKSSLLNTNSEERLEISARYLDNYRMQCQDSLTDLGKEKIHVLDSSIKTFLELFTQLKKVDFTNSVGLEELEKIRIDSVDFEELERMSSFASSILAGTVAGTTSGAITAFGAYSAAGLLAHASTGTAIASLHGAAATNATLAFFGGGSLASGGLGIAGGTAVLGGLVAGPALLVMGTILGAKAGKNLENAKTNAAEVNRICEEYKNGVLECQAIRRRSNMFYSALARLDAKFVPLLLSMEEIIKSEGTDYSMFSKESKETVAAAATLAVSIKSILDTPLLNDDGSLTEESKAIGGY